MVDGERRTIFSGLSFAIEPGEIVDLVGPSGAGKSSLLTAFARLNPRASGDLRLDGRSADDFTPQQWRAQVAYLPQKPVLLGETVAQAIRLPFTLAIRQSARTKQGPRRISPTDALPDGRIRETLDNMGCADIDLNRPPHDLSGGQVARVSLARTLLTRPKVLLADEVDTLLALGATTWEAARPSIVSSIRLGLLPTTASLASAGIVTVPGMMAGQIIAGGNPIDAAKYQFMILATIAALTLLADSIIMLMVYKRCFTALDQYQPVNG